MKKIFFLILLLTQMAFTQENYKGKISLILGGEKIEAPVTSIVLRKEDSFILTTRAEINVEEKQVLISFEIVFKGDTISETPKELRLVVKKSNKFESTGKEFLFHYPSETNDDAIIKYAFYNKDEHVSMEISSLSFFYSLHPLFENERIIINGTFKGKFNSSSPGNNSTMEIKDGEFEIII